MTDKPIQDPVAKIATMASDATAAALDGNSDIVQPTQLPGTIRSINYPGNKYAGEGYKRVINIIPPHTVWYAGEGYKRVINIIPPHTVWYAGFLGSCAVTAHKKPARFNIATEVTFSHALQQFWDKNKPTQKFRIEQKSFFDVIKPDLGAWISNYCWVPNHIYGEKVLVYLDPPYLLSSRRSGKEYYANELTEAQHVDLLLWAASAQCMVIIQHYPCELYDTALKGWNYIDYDCATRQGTVVERIYYNYPTPTVLHEYTYLGDTNVKRQTIKRTIDRAVRKIATQPMVVQNAIMQKLAALQAAKTTHHAD